MLRLGSIPYLNGRPLTWTLASDPDVELVEEIPSLLTRRIPAGDVEAALVPVVECLRGGLSILPGMCIGSAGPVGSVLLFLTRPLDQVKRVALDGSSRTSAALAQVLLAASGRECEYAEAPPDLPTMLAGADAALLIGDPALREAERQRSLPEPLPHLDLGEEWARLTGLPFVYAVWAAQPGYDWPIAERLRQAMREGLGRLEEIVQREAGPRALPLQVCRRYLSRQIRYRMTERHLAGLREFGRRCHKLGLVGADWEPRLWPG